LKTAALSVATIRQEEDEMFAVREDHQRAKGVLTTTHAGRQILFREHITFELHTP
jgi:conjugal transfer/entry exclusion protein